ncbi:hypothetical protein [Parabacteroides sp. FAFU027]|uniref:hypothetical protein n=1 Tax=Parabacteroides sp. FAFU027 TaxID=2922715 RepID=UPI001FAF89A3|nr:hypothetical protein [Parabacteroides sp. FAFU027]
MDIIRTTMDKITSILYNVEATIRIVAPIMYNVEATLYIIPTVMSIVAPIMFSVWPKMDSNEAVLPYTATPLCLDGGA